MTLCPVLLVDVLNLHAQFVQSFKDKQLVCSFGRKAPSPQKVVDSQPLLPTESSDPPISGGSSERFVSDSRNMEVENGTEDCPRPKQEVFHSISKNVNESV